MIETKLINLDSIDGGRVISGIRAESDSHPEIADSLNNEFDADSEGDLLFWLKTAFSDNPDLEIEVSVWTEHGESGLFWTNELGIFFGWISTDNIWDSFSFRTGEAKDYKINQLLIE